MSSADGLGRDPHLEVLRIQSAYRARLAATWPIAPGSRILEIGCGQGDTTAILAEAVGSQGHVTAVDIASPDYGAPMTLGEATDRLKVSALGPRIDFRFNFDLLNPAHEFEKDGFDCVVLAHSSWYFASAEELFRALTQLKLWATRLCFAEWDLEPHSFEQVPHLLAVLIQGQVEAFKPQSLSNVRTPLAKARVKDLLREAGWTLTTESSVDTESLQDADWEIAACLASARADAQASALPSKFLELLESQLDLLQRLAKPQKNRPLPAYSMVLERHPLRPQGV